MNRTVAMGVAIFFALVGIALVGEHNQVIADGHGCSGGADSGAACGGGQSKCSGRAKKSRCSGGGLLSRLRSKKCSGSKSRGSKGCSGASSCSGAAPAPAPAPACSGSSSCKGASRCSGRAKKSRCSGDGLLSRLRSKKCSGSKSRGSKGCSGGASAGCNGASAGCTGGASHGEVIIEKVEDDVVPPAPAKKASLNRTPLMLRLVSFR